MVVGGWSPVSKECLSNTPTDRVVSSSPKPTRVWTVGGNPHRNRKNTQLLAERPQLTVMGSNQEPLAVSAQC